MRKEAGFEVMDRIKVTYNGSEKAERSLQNTVTRSAGKCLQIKL